MTRRPADKPAQPAVVETTEQRLADIELLTSVNLVGPMAEGRPLAKCSVCGGYATRQIRFEHPHAATFYQASCATCELRHPLVNQGASVITYEPIPGYPKACVELAEKINAARARVRARQVRA